MIDVAEKSSKKMTSNLSQSTITKNYTRIKIINIVKAVGGPVGCWLPLCVLCLIQLCGVVIEPVVSLCITVFGALCALYNPIVHVILKTI